MIHFYCLKSIIVLLQEKATVTVISSKKFLIRKRKTEGNEILAAQSAEVQYTAELHGELKRMKKTGEYIPNNLKSDNKTKAVKTQLYLGLHRYD